jgi:hypothetical protein
VPLVLRLDSQPSGLLRSARGSSDQIIPASVSLSLHIAILLYLVWPHLGPHVDPVSPPTYQVVVVPLVPKERLQWYVTPSQVPEVTPQKRFGPHPTPHGEQDPDRVLISRTPAPKSTEELIRQPDHPKPIPRDVPAPNLVAVHSGEPEAVPKPPTKTFVPPQPTVSRSEARAPDLIEPPPSVKPSVLEPSELQKFEVSAPKAPRRKFVLPSATAQKLGPVAAPQEMSAPPALGTHGNTTTGPEAVIINLVPAAVPPPPGSRSGQFAKAPTAGTPSSGSSAQSGAVTVPGLVAHGTGAEPRKPEVVPAPSIPERRPSQEILLPGLNRTMSAPLRPSSRIIPHSVEAQFANRNVYTLVIPSPNVPGYSDDWVMWFSERHSDDDPRAHIAAPIPVRKYGSSAPGVVTLSPVASIIQFAAIIDRNGRIAAPKIIRGSSDPPVMLKAMEELASWEFQPALRNGEPIDVDIVLEIPFQLLLATPAPVTSH